MLSIDKSKCIGCGICTLDCTREVIFIENGKAEINEKPCLKCWHCVAICPQNAVSSDECKVEDMVQYSEEDFRVNVDNLLNLIKFRRSSRNYKEEKVESQKLQKLIEAGRFSPTGCNRQPFRYIILDGGMEEIKLLCMKALSDLAEKTPNSPSIANDVIRQRFLNMETEYKETGRDRLFFNAPQVMILIADISLGGRPLLDGGIAAANMELTAVAQDLGTCYIGFFATAVEYSQRVREKIGLKDNENMVACFTIGYPKYTYRRTVSRNEEKVQII